MAALQDVQSVDYPANIYGPSIVIANLTQGTYNLFCPIPLQVPAGATVTLTGATLAYSDFSSTCLVGASLRSNTFGASYSFGALPISTVYDGTGASDFAYTSGGPLTKAFPTFTPLTLTPSTVLWAQAFVIEGPSSTSYDCRYSGVQITYTIDRP